MRKGIVPLVALAVIAILAVAGYLAYKQLTSAEKSAIESGAGASHAGTKKTPAASATPTAGVPLPSITPPSGTKPGEAGSGACINIPDISFLGTYLANPNDKESMKYFYNLTVVVRSIDELQNLPNLIQSFTVTNQKCDAVDVELQAYDKDLEVTPDAFSLDKRASAKINVKNKANFRRLYTDTAGNLKFELSRPGIITDHHVILLSTDLSQIVTTLELPKNAPAVGKTYGDYIVYLTDVQTGKATFKIAMTSKPGLENAIETREVAENSVNDSGATPVRIALIMVEPGAYNAQSKAVFAADAGAKATAQQQTDTLTIELVPRMALTFADGTAKTLDIINVSSQNPKAFTVEANFGGIIRTVESSILYLEVGEPNKYANRYVFDTSIGYFGTVITGTSLLYNALGMGTGPKNEVSMTLVDGKGYKLPPSKRIWQFQIVTSPVLRIQQVSYSSTYPPEPVRVGFVSGEGAVLKELSDTRAILEIKR